MKLILIRDRSTDEFPDSSNEVFLRTVPDEVSYAEEDGMIDAVGVVGDSLNTLTLDECQSIFGVIPEPGTVVLLTSCVFNQVFKAD